MNSRERLEFLCKRIGGSLRSLAQMRASGLLSEERFVAAVRELEEEILSTDGFTLRTRDTAEGWTLFTLHITGCDDSCASFEFRPETGEIRRADAPATE